jgi:hypothetical protein
MRVAATRDGLVRRQTSFVAFRTKSRGLECCIGPGQFSARDLHDRLPVVFVVLGRDVELLEEGLVVAAFGLLISLGVNLGDVLV